MTRANEEKSRPSGEWFAECLNEFSNKGLAAFLSAQGSGYESELASITVPCGDGVNRPLFRILGTQVRSLLKLQKGSDVLKFRIWKRDHDGVPAYLMNFIGGGKGPRSSPAFKSAADRLRAIKSAQTTGSSDPSF